MIDPFNAAVNYSFNDSGQLTGATATGFPGISTFGSGIQYRAWGGLKHGSYKTSSNGNTFTVDASYNGRLLMTHYTQAGGQFDYQHYADGRISFAGDLANPFIFDRAYSYDHVGRLSQGLTGDEARGGTNPDGPFKQTYGYDVFDNMTSRHNRFWSQPDDPFTATYVNARNTAWGYDVAGNIKNDTLTHKFDVVSRPTHVTDSIGLFVIDQSYDGDGQPAKRVEQRPSLNYPITTFYVRSSVLGGQVVSELVTTGFRAGTHNTFVYMNGTQIAVNDSWLNQVLSKMTDPVIGQGLDPLGGYVGFTDPFVQNPNTTYDSLHPGEALYFQDANPFDPGSGCELDGMPTDCSRLTRALENGTVGVYIGAAGKIGRVYDVSNYQGGFGGMWVSMPTPSDPEYDNDMGSFHLKVTDNAYKDVWVPFGGAQSTGQFREGPLWSNASKDRQDRVTYVVQKIQANQGCLDWFNIHSEAIGHGANLTKLLQNTGLNFYLAGDKNRGVSLKGLEGLHTNKFGVDEGFGETLFGGSAHPQIVINRQVLDYKNDPELAVQLIHELFHAAGLHQGSDPRHPIIGRANDQYPEVKWEDIEKNCKID